MLAAIAAALVAGCGRTVTVGAGGTLQIAVTEYHLNPQSVRASSGQLTIVVHNYGRLTHNLVISQNGQAVAATQPIAPGQSAALALFMAKGRYTMASTVLSDESLGAYGTLTVR
jgi:hypothetical protein